MTGAAGTCARRGSVTVCVPVALSAVGALFSEASMCFKNTSTQRVTTHRECAQEAVVWLPRLACDLGDFGYGSVTHLLCSGGQPLQPLAPSLPAGLLGFPGHKAFSLWIFAASNRSLCSCLSNKMGSKACSIGPGLALICCDRPPSPFGGGRAAGHVYGWDYPRSFG